MANGDTAASAGMDVVPEVAPVHLGFDEINKTRDYIKTKFDAWIALHWPLAVAKGGTGATTPAAARTNLGLPNKVVENDGASNNIKMRWTNLRIRARIDSTDVGDLAYLADVTALIERLDEISARLEALEAGP